MQTIYRLNSSDLTPQFLESLKTLFNDKEIEIIVHEVDETSYLFAADANKQRLLKAIQNVEAGKDLVTVPTDLFQ